MKKYFLAGMALGLVSCVLMRAAYAADLAPQPDPGPAVHGDVTIYGWGPTIGGKLGFDGYGPVDIPDGSTSVADMLKALDSVFMGNASVHYGDWGLFGDVVWADFGQGKTSASGYAESRSSIAGLVGTAALTYTLVDTPEGHLDALAGARFWSVDAGLKLSILGGAFDVDRDKNINWVDPLVGLRGRYAISPDFFVSGTGAIGGFGVGSDFMWDAAAAIGYNFNDNFSAEIGYRALGTNYRRNGDVIDIVAHGPLVGLTGRF